MLNPARYRNQKAAWWARDTFDDYGRYSFSSPVEIDVRWDTNRVEFRDDKGEVHTSEGTVYSDRELGVGDMLSLGEVESSTPADPLDETDAFEVAWRETFPLYSGAAAQVFVNYLAKKNG